MAVGTRVRLWEQAARDLSLPVVGTLSRITSDTIDIRANGSDSPRGVPRQLVTRVEISLGPHSGSRSASAWMGAAIGGLGAGILGIIAGNLSRSNAARLGLVGAIGGAGVGAAIGASQPGESWRRAVLPPASPAGP